ncbi:unnamed protein product, partial [Amoebophrya sp. A120]
TSSGGPEEKSSSSSMGSKKNVIPWYCDPARFRVFGKMLGQRRNGHTHFRLVNTSGTTAGASRNFVDPVHAMATQGSPPRGPAARSYLHDSNPFRDSVWSGSGGPSGHPLQGDVGNIGDTDFDRAVVIPVSFG